MTPLRDALALVRSAPLPVRLEIVTPAYPCAGTGTLRVVRALQTGDAIELAAAYEGYDRLEPAR